MNVGNWCALGHNDSRTTTASHINILLVMANRWIFSVSAKHQIILSSMPFHFECRQGPPSVSCASINLFFARVLVAILLLSVGLEENNISSQHIHNHISAPPTVTLMSAWVLLISRVTISLPFHCSINSIRHIARWWRVKFYFRRSFSGRKCIGVRDACCTFHLLHGLLYPSLFLFLIIVVIQFGRENW